MNEKDSTIAPSKTVSSKIIAEDIPSEYDKDTIKLLIVFVFSLAVTYAFFYVLEFFTVFNSTSTLIIVPIAFLLTLIVKIFFIKDSFKNRVFKETKERDPYSLYGGGK